MLEKRYRSYSDYLKEKYQEKVYKLPVNLPLTCPNRLGGNTGCSFCADVGTGFEALDSSISVTDQLNSTKSKIEKKYHAHKFIAYFQNYTNTFLPYEQFCSYIMEAAAFPDIVEVAISTRPDCIREDYLKFLSKIREQYHVEITIELGLQTVNYHTLHKINRGHGLAEFIDAVLMIRQYQFDICTHVILNLPYDDEKDCLETARVLSALKIPIVKIHSLYVAKNSVLCDLYENGTISICSKEEYLQRLMLFIENLSPQIAIERLFSRIPESESVFCNWNCSWWKLKDEFEQLLKDNDSYQGKQCHYLNGAALDLL